MSDFVIQLLDLCIMLFSATDNVIVFVPTFCIFFCFGFAIVRRLIRIW